MKDSTELNAKLTQLQQENLRLHAKLDALITLLPQSIVFKDVKTSKEKQLLASNTKTKRTLKQLKPKKGWSRWIQVQKLIFRDPVTDKPQVLVVETDVSDLKEQDKLLKNITNSLDDFASLTSHDLQAPLRHIGIFSEMLESEYLNALDETGEMYLQEIRSGVNNMRVQIDGFLRFIRNSPTGIELDSIDMSDVFKDCHSEIKTTLDDIGGSLTYPTESIWVQGDAVMLNQALRILLDNCIKYRHPDRALKINITHKVLAELTEIVIKDNGIGIDHNRRNTIFNLFDRSRPLSETKGLSVGLALCKRIMVFHGGNVELKNRKTGAGFSLELKNASQSL